MSLPTRQEALKTGSRFYAGRPCAHGHTVRYTKTRACRECSVRRWSDDGECARANSRQKDRYHRGKRAIEILLALGIEI
jgi:hypothetical protein